MTHAREGAEPRLRLRPLVDADLPFGRDDEPSEFDDFGPREPYAAPPPCRVDADGTLGVEVDATLVGTVGWHWMQYGPSAASRCPMIGISLLAQHRGKGYGTSAQRLLVDLLFAATTVNRVEASTDIHNVAEQRALERAGLTREGMQRGAQWRRGAFHDCVTYAVLRSEWERAGGEQR